MSQTAGSESQQKRIAQLERKLALADQGLKQAAHIRRQWQQAMADLEKARAQLQESLTELANSQTALAESSRLAVVGEMAGRTAHEVLNPVTVIHGRITRMLDSEQELFNEGLDAFGAVVDGWSDAFREGGMEGLNQALSEQVHDEELGNVCVVEQDLEMLREVRTVLAKAVQEQVADLRFLRSETERIQHVIDSMRGLTRQSSEWEILSPEELCRKTMTIMEDKLGAKGVRMRLSVRADVAIRVERYEMIQVLTNLVQNAANASVEKNGDAGSIVTLVIDRLDSNALIRVVDQGCGIAPEQVEYVFEAGYTTQSATEGTGLGLSIAQRFVRGFGGDLMLEKTEVGAGTTFLVKLPVAQVDNLENEVEATEAEDSVFAMNDESSSQAS